MLGQRAELIYILVGDKYMQLSPDPPCHWGVTFE